MTQGERGVVRIGAEQASSLEHLPKQRLARMVQIDKVHGALRPVGELFDEAHLLFGVQGAVEQYRDVDIAIRGCGSLSEGAEQQS